MTDNTHYTGIIDRARVATTQDYEMDYFIDQYLRTRNFTVSAQNSQIVRNRIPLFAGNPKMRDQLSAYLDLQFGM